MHTCCCHCCCKALGCLCHSDLIGALHSLLPSTSTSCLTHHCLDSILNILPSSPTGWFNVRASLPPCSASLPQYLRAPSVCTLLPACFSCAALPHHTPCCLEHGRPSRPFIFSIFTVATLFFLFIISMVTSLAPLSLRQPQGMVNSMGVSWEFTPSLLLGSPFLNPSLRSHTCSRGILLCAVCSVTGDSLLGMVVISPVSPS